MSRIHVVADTSFVPIFADLVGFFHGGPLDQALMFTDKRKAPGHHNDWIVISQENPLGDWTLGFAGLDNARDSYSLRVYFMERVPVHVFGEPVQIQATYIFHDYRFRMLASIFGDVRVYLSSEATSPQSLPHWYVEALDRAMRRSRRPDPLSDVMEARRLLLETDSFDPDSPQFRHSDPFTSLHYWRNFHDFSAGLPGARPDIGSSTVCFECGLTVKTEHVWLKKSDQNIALCEGCFRTAETAGRAKGAVDV